MLQPDNSEWPLSYPTEPDDRPNPAPDPHTCPANNADDSPMNIAANDGTPGNNQAQNRQFRDVVNILGLTPDQARQLHDEISGENYGFHEILQTGRDMFGK